MRSAQMKTTVTLISVGLLILAVSPETVIGGGYWARFGGGVSFFSMSDFNDGVAQMNALVVDSYRLGILDERPDISDDDLSALLSDTTSGKQLDSLDNGLTFSIALARRFGSALSIGLEWERIFAASDRVMEPEAYMNYTAPASLYKIFVELDLKTSDRWSFGLAGAGGYAQADGYLVMPPGADRVSMKEAYLSGGGPLFEGAAVVGYHLDEEVALNLLLGYRMTDLDESDQNWFGESPSADPDPRAMPLESIPLKLDYSGFFLKLGVTLRLG